VTSVAPASSTDRMPLPKPPTQKNGMGRYSRVSAPMHRASSPDRTAPSALPCEWMTPLGGPLLPEVNMQLRPRILALRPGTRIVSHDWDMGDWQPDKTIVVDAPDKTIGREKKSRIHLWVVR